MSLQEIQSPENEVGAVGDARPGQDNNLIAELGIGRSEPLILSDGLIHPVPSLMIDDMDFRPRRRQEHPAMIAVGAAQRLNHGLARQVFKRDGGVDQAAIKEDPTVQRRGGAVVQGDGDGPSSEGGRIDPRQRRAVARLLLRDNAPAGLLDHHMTAATQLSQQS